MSAYQSKASLDVKILFGNVNHLIDLEIRKMLELGLTENQDFNIPFWSMIYLLSKLKFISESDNRTESEFRCQINHGPEWNVEFSISIQTPYRYFSNFWALKMSHFTKQDFLI